MKLRKILSVGCLFIILLNVVRCGNDEPSINNKPIITDRGTAQGNATTASIGTAGGSLTSGDGRLTVTVPAGALTSNTTISIQPISNEGPLGLGLGYRLSPEGITFQQPVMLTFTYNDQVLGHAEEDFLWIITQAEDGSWNALLKSEVNTSTKTVTVTTTHFSDWALGRFIDLKLDPASKTLVKGASVNLKLSGFSSDQPDSPDDLAPLIPIDPNEDFLTPLTPIPPNEEQFQRFAITGWSLNGGLAPVSNSNGSLNASKNNATYKAPNAKPSVNPVAVSVHLEGKKKNGQTVTYMVTSGISIVDSDLYVLVKIDGVTHEYYQYGLNGSIPPDPNNISIANCGTDGEGRVMFGGMSAQNGTTMLNGFSMVIHSPTEGTRSLTCYEAVEDDAYDEVSFQFSAGGKYYALDYVKRTPVNQNCDSDYLCGDGSITFITYENKTMGNVRGYFSGTIYEDAPANSCVSDIAHTFEGEFWLKRVD